MRSKVIGVTRQQGQTAQRARCGSGVRAHCHCALGLVMCGTVTITVTVTVVLPLRTATRNQDLGSHITGVSQVAPPPPLLDRLYAIITRAS